MFIKILRKSALFNLNKILYNLKRNGSTTYHTSIERRIAASNTRSGTSSTGGGRTCRGTTQKGCEAYTCAYTSSEKKRARIRNYHHEYHHDYQHFFI